MKRKTYQVIIYILAVFGLFFLVNWGLKVAEIIDRKYTVSIGERLSIGFSDIGDHVEIYNFDGEPFLDKSILIFVDNNIISTTNIQNRTDGEKGAEIVFSSYIEDKAITVVHEDSGGIPSYRIIRDEDGRPTKEDLSELIWSTDPVEARNDGSFDAVTP